MTKIEKFIELVAEDLGIGIPEIRYKVKLQTDTMLAMADIKNGTLYIKKNLSEELDSFFVIAHEMRHLWQSKEDPDYFFDRYKPSSVLKDIEEYNLQIAELDANAYAVTIMEDFFNATPQFNGLSASLKTKIYHMASLM